MQQSINEFLQEKRLAMNLSIQQLAKESAISASHLSRIEKGLRNPSPQTLKALAEPLNVDYVTLLKVGNLLNTSTNECIDIRSALLNKTLVFDEKEVPEKVKNSILEILQNHFNLLYSDAMDETK